MTRHLDEGNEETTAIELRAPARPEVGGTRPNAAIAWWVGALLFVAAVLVPLLRQRGAHSWDTIWAEDGTIYGSQALRHGGFAVLLRGYMGYLQLPPRLIALVIPLVPIRQLALFLAVVGSTVNALLAWFVYRQSRGWITSPLLRLALASSLVIGPAMLAENTANITNTIWTFAAVAPLALGSLQDRPASVVARSGVAFLAATSTALSFLYLPLAVVVVVTRRTRPTLIVVGSFVFGLIVQGIVVLQTSSPPALPGNEIGELVRALGVRVFWWVMVGPRFTSSLWPTPSITISVVGGVIVVALFVAASLGAGTRTRIAAATLFATAVLIYVVPVWGRGTVLLTVMQGISKIIFEERFSVIPVFLLLSAAMILLDDPERRPTPWTRVAAIALVVQIALLTVVNFSGANGRSYVKDTTSYPPWSSLVESAWRTCDGEASTREIEIPASFMFPVTVTCQELAP